MRIPSVEEVESSKYDQLQLARWYRFGQYCTYEREERDAMDLILRYFKGWNPGLSKQVGWVE